MIKHWIAAALVTLAPAVALAQALSEGPKTNSLVQVPPNARLIGTSEVDEVRQFPEQKAGKPMERIVGVSALDRVYEVEKPYADAVKFFDTQFQQKGFQQMSRTMTPTSTAWVVRRPDGNVANVIVRNTTPSTVEAVEVVSAQANEKK
jgi:hypothetical protein